jgi:phosphoribosylglycinamide formyltransferase-1
MYLWPTKSTMKRIVIFASGSGTNAQRIAEYFGSNVEIDVTRIYCNNKDAFVLKRAESLKIPSTLFNRNEFYHSDKILNSLKIENPDLIVLAGFLWLIPQKIIENFSHKIVNIHPALLPKYGGKGMYGHFVHDAVIKSGDKESGITIHYVNEAYDEGMIIFQARCPVDKNDTANTLAQRIHELEYAYFPETLEKLLKK